MSDFVLHYDILESIAKRSNSLGMQADEYANSLTRRVANAITSVTGSSSGYLEDASYYVNEKVGQLQKKAQEFYDFASQVIILAETATRVDEEVQKLLAESQEEFLQHHESLRIDDWKADILNWLVGIKNKLPFLEVLGNILSAVDTLLETCLDSIKYWYCCEGGKYIVEFVGGIALAALVVAIFALTLPASGFVAICGAIGAGIAAVNAVTNVATSFRAAYTACNGDPTWARIYSKQNTLSGVIRETNFTNGTLNGLSYLGADVIDATEMVCCIVGIGQIGKSIKKLFAKKNFNIFKKGSFHLGDFKASIKKSFTDTKVGIKKGFTDLKTNVKGGYTYLKSNLKNGLFGKVDDVDEIAVLNKLDDVSVNRVDDLLSEGGSQADVYIPRDANGNPISLNKQKVNGQDIPLPDPNAQGPHTVLGGKISSKTGEVYRQSATFPEGSWPTANGQNVPWSEVHWTDHGTPKYHVNPHQHIFTYEWENGGGWFRGGPTEIR
jgi:hypothetical protein